ncbi:tyrosine-type recombinase/integrase [Halobellus ruber]|uniref:Site-specific integrase n=1 Tax=Halobellus ruber TaxID=2761102 RepID=A0A7J9SLK1_9EURY|nr:site-specific integrase [Halobellus ruber]MBB6647805.1 site-specific integrase [Halobellus ruber]
MVDRTQTAGSSRDQGHETTLQDAVEYYLDSRDSGIYQSTASHILKSFIEHIEDRGAETVADLDTRVLVTYASYLRRRVDGDGISPATARNYYDVVSGWLTYCVRRGWLESNPAFRQAPKEELPEDTSDPTTQQRWTRQNRVEIVRWADWRAESAAEHEWMDPTVASRDRALIALFGYTGVRGAEVLRDGRDEQRDGLRWSNVDLETGQMRVWAKKREWQRVAIHERALRYLRVHKRRQNPTNDEWPVFATRHAHTLLKGLPDDVDSGDYLAAYREYDRIPQAPGTHGGRSVLETLCIESGIRASDGDVLKPHAARRGLGKELYQQQPEKAQEQLRHEDLAVTNKHYNDVETAEQKESLDSMID